MSTSEPRPPAATVSPPAAAPAALIGDDSARPHPPAGDSRPKVNGRYIGLLLFAQFGLYVAVVAPMAFSLAVRLTQLSDNQGLLGYVIGAGALSLVIAGPIFGVLSDRTRSRLGRRRPWLLGSVLVGLAGLIIVALAPSVLVLALGWVVVQLGMGTSMVVLLNSMADRLPESQRGKVAGLVGVAQMGASVIGAGVAGALTSSNLLLLLVPGSVGVLGALLFVVFVPEADSRTMAASGQMTLRTLLSTYVFDVRRYSDFAWNWLGRFLFLFGLTLATTFTSFFFAMKLGRAVHEIGGVIAIVGGLGIIATMGGAGLSGFLSDKLRRRRSFVFVAAVLFALGAIVMTLAPSFEILVVGSFLTNLGLGVFSAVDQALVLDVLPEQNTSAGRFTAINQFATTVPQSLAPLTAPLLLAFGGGDNYPVVYTVAAAFALLGGSVILLRVRSVR